MGYDPEAIESASTDYLERDDDADYLTPDLDDSQKQITVSECYLHMDINEDGIGELVKVTVIGESNPSEILDIEEICEMPFVAMSAIPMPHSFMGMSVFDRLKQVQDVKTAVLRSTLDSFYQSVNRIKVVQEGAVNLDDLLVNRPGGIIRAKGHNAVTELGGTFFGGEALQLLQYADTQKDSRVGVSPNMAGQANLVNNESAHGVERVTPFKFRGQWQNINPSSWGDRSRMMVTVGTGASDDQQKIGMLSQMFQIQQGIMQQDPMNPLVDYSKIYNTIDELSDLAGIGEAEKYMYNPMSPEGQQFGQQKQQQGQQQQQQAMQQQQQQLEMQQAALQAQMQVAQAEQTKAQATMQNGQMKEQINAMKAQHSQELEQLKTALQAAKDSKQNDFQIQQLKTNAALKLTELEINAKRDLSKQNADNQGEVNGKKGRSVSGRGGEG